MKRRWVEIGVIGFSAGIVLRSFVSVSITVAVFTLVLAAALAFFVARSPSSFKKEIIVLSFFLAATVGGIARYELSEPRSIALNDFKNEFITAEGVVVAEPDPRDNTTFLTIVIDVVGEKKETAGISEKVRVAIDRFPEYFYGDRVRFVGKLVAPENFLTDQGTVFDYQSYLAKDGIYFEMFRPKITLVAHSEGNPIVAALLRFKLAFLSATSRIIPEPENGLLAGIILGIKHGIPDSLAEAFRRSGLVHIIVLSGYNLTIVAAALMAFVTWFHRFLPRFVPPLVGIVGIVAFTIMAGASATAVRAAIMALLAILARFVGRKYDISRAIAVAAFIMVVHNPKVLAFDPSFQLSFLATLGIVYLAPFFESRFTRITDRFGIKSIVAATFATQIFVLPRLVALSGAVSLFGVLANIIVLPFVPLTMLLGALTGFSALVYDLLAAPFAFGAYFLLHAFVKIAEVFSSLPFSSIPVPVPPTWLTVAVYAALFYGVYHMNKSYKQTLN